MRLFFWVAALAALLLLGLGLAASVPSLEDVPGQALADWYATQFLFAVGIGVLAGAAGGFWARRTVRHVPHLPASVFLTRVATRGFLTVAGAALLAAATFALFASRNTDIHKGQLDRVLMLVPTLKFLGVASTAALGAAITFAISTRALRWGGQYALVGHNFVPRIAD